MVIQRVANMHIDFWPKIPKANFQNGEMKITFYLTMNYEQKVMKYENKNKPKSNPILNTILQKWRNLTIYINL